MNEPTATLLARAAGQSLEEAAFVLTEPVEEPPEWDGPVDVVELGFTGPASGRLLMAAPRRFGCELASNLLGVDPEDAAVNGRGSEALAEMANIVGGVLMEALFGPDTLTRLGLPEVRRVEGPVADAMLSATRRRVSLLADDEHRLDVAVAV